MQMFRASFTIWLTYRGSWILIVNRTFSIWKLRPKKPHSIKEVETNPCCCDLPACPHSSFFVFVGLLGLEGGELMLGKLVVFSLTPLGWLGLC